MPDNNLYKRGNVFWGRIKVNGKDHRRSLRTTSRTEARKRLADFKKEMEHVAYYGEARHSWKEAVVHYAQDLMPQAVKEGTAKRYLVSLRMVEPHLANLFIDEIGRKQIGALVRNRLREGASNATVRRDLTAVSRVLSGAVSLGWVDTNPAKDWDRDVIPENRDPIARVTDENVDTFIAKAPDGFGRVVRFLLQTGMRQMEAVNLRHSQLVPETGEVRLSQTKTRPRVITLSDAAWGTLKGTPKSTDTDYVFLSQQGSHFKNFASRFKQIGNRAGTSFRCHDLRHEFAIRELENGRDIYDLSRHLGHSSVKTTEIYLDYVGHDGVQLRAQRRRSEEEKGRSDG
jgi:integrase